MKSSSAAFCPISLAMPTLSQTADSAFASESLFSSVNIPLRPSVTPSAAQLPLIRILPNEHAAASRTTIPLVSYVEGNTNISPQKYNVRRISLSCIAPVNTHIS